MRADLPVVVGGGQAVGPGDVARLRSGGPDVTVVRIDGAMAECEWFEKKPVAMPFVRIDGLFTWEFRREFFAVVGLERVG